MKDAVIYAFYSRETSLDNYGRAKDLSAPPLNGGELE